MATALKALLATSTVVALVAYLAAQALVDAAYYDRVKTLKSELRAYDSRNELLYAEKQRLQSELNALQTRLTWGIQAAQTREAMKQRLQLMLEQVSADGNATGIGYNSTATQLPDISPTTEAPKLNITAGKAKTTTVRRVTRAS